MLIRLDEAGFNSRPETLRRAQTFTLEHLVMIYSHFLRPPVGAR